MKKLGQIKKHLGRLAHSTFKDDLPERGWNNKKIKILGVKSSGIDFVLLTHLHSDHVSGLKHVQDAKRLLTK